jgi:hypothetical protein
MSAAGGLEKGNCYTIKLSVMRLSPTKFLGNLYNILHTFSFEALLPYIVLFPLELDVQIPAIYAENLEALKS